MSAILHCVITSIEDDRIRENLKAWKDNVNISKNENSLNKLTKILDGVCPYTPYFELIVKKTKTFSFYYDDDEEGKDALHEVVEDILINEREEYKDSTISVRYCFFNRDLEELTKITKIMFRVK